MSSRSIRLAVAVAVPVIALAVGRWLDYDVVLALQHRQGVTFEVDGLGYAMSADHVAAGAGAIAIFAALWWSRSVALAIGYIAVGGFVALLPALTFDFATSYNGAPPVLPEPVARFIGDQWLGPGIGAGMIGLTLTLGGAMVVAGLVVIGARLWPARAPGAPQAVAQPE